MHTSSLSTLSTTELLAQIRTPVSDDIQAVNRLIIQQLSSKIPLIQTIARHILDSGGKRLRPLVVLLSSQAFGYQGIEHHELAVIIEFVHTATLLHDDVVDQSKRRRGQETANEIWGNQASVLVGDFLYSRAFQLLAQRSHATIMQLLANTTNMIAEGEISQLASSHNPEMNEQEYRAVIQQKTASLFAAASEMGAILGGGDATQCQAMQQYGLHLGMAFQIIDDLLDYTADTLVLGKNCGDDLAEGKMTLPLIYALTQCQPHQKEMINTAVRDGDVNQLPQILALLTETGAKDYVLKQAYTEANQARQALALIPTNSAKQALEQLIEFVLTRNN